MLLRDADSVMARTVKFLAYSQWAGSREGNGGVLMGEPPPKGENDDALPF